MAEQVHHTSSNSWEDVVEEFGQLFSSPNSQLSINQSEIEAIEHQLNDIIFMTQERFNEFRERITHDQRTYWERQLSDLLALRHRIRRLKS